jgi:hypothetical protein
MMTANRLLQANEELAAAITQRTLTLLKIRQSDWPTDTLDDFDSEKVARQVARHLIAESN